MKQLKSPWSGAREGTRRSPAQEEGQSYKSSSWVRQTGRPGCVGKGCWRHLAALGAAAAAGVGGVGVGAGQLQTRVLSNYTQCRSWVTRVSKQVRGSPQQTGSRQGSVSTEDVDFAKRRDLRA